jgi:hypothetical protein
MEVGMEVDQITEALDRDHGTRYTFRPVQGYDPPGTKFTLL